VLLLERHEFPAVSASFILDRGSAAAPPGVAALYSKALYGGSTEFSSKETFGYFSYVGASPSTWAARDGLGLRVTTLSPLIDGALARAASMFTAPLLEGEDLAAARNAATQEANEDKDSPSERATQALRGLVLGADHPYARPVYAGTGERFAKMSRQELENFGRMFVVPERMTVAVVGDFRPENILARLENRLGKLPKRSAAEAPSSAKPAAPTKTRIVVLPRKGASQSNVAIGFPGVATDSDDRVALDVLASILGRGLSGRLNLKVRGAHGFTYGVRMDSRSWRNAGVVEISAAVDTEHTADSVKGLLGELARIGTQPIGAEELVRAKINAGSTLDAAAGKSLSTLFVMEHAAMEHLPADWDDRDTGRIEALQEADVRAAASRYLTPDTAQIAIVGDPDVIVGPLRALGIGDVVVDSAR
jgi:predicted Zn-dependent peptidase